MVSKNDLDATERGEYAYGRLRASSGGGAAPASSYFQTPGMRVVSVLSVLAVATLLVVTLHPGIGPGSSSAYRAGIHGQATTPGIQKNKQDPSSGMCRYNYSVPTWTGEEALACDPAVCEGADKLQVMATPSEKQRRWSTDNEAAYMNLYRKGHIGGWLHEPNIHYVRALTELQHNISVFGAVGEIGVHHGKFLMPIVGFALEEEPAVAMDLFEDQQQNIDGSGKGSTAALLENLKSVGIDEAHVKRIAGNSMHLKAGDVSAHGLPAFRMFSVDGGHSLETTLHDMMLASCLLRDGGIMILDDVTNPTWQGVAEAMFHFSFANKRMVPLLMGYNKAYFTTVSHVEQYRKFVKDNPEIFDCMRTHASRRAMAGQDYCFVEDKNA